MTDTKQDFSLNILLALTNKLAGLVRNETDFLKQMKISEIAKLQQEKNEIAAVLEKQQNYLRSDAELRANLTSDEKSMLKRAATNFDAAIHDYQNELFKAQKVNELVIGKIMEAVKDHVTKNRSYNKMGTKIASGIELAKNTPAIKFNAQV